LRTVPNDDGTSSVGKRGTRVGVVGRAIRNDVSHAGVSGSDFILNEGGGSQAEGRCADKGEYGKRRDEPLHDWIPLIAISLLTNLMASEEI
jgi:hypothetical protein